MLASGLWNQSLVGTRLAVPPPLLSPSVATKRSVIPSDHETHSVNSMNRRILNPGKSFRNLLGQVRHSNESDQAEREYLLQRVDTRSSFTAREHIDYKSDTSETVDNIPGDYQKRVTNGERTVTVDATVNVKSDYAFHQPRPCSHLNSTPPTSHYQFQRPNTSDPIDSTLDYNASPTPNMAESFEHRRGDSFHVNWTALDLPRLAQEIYEETIADVHLSLFGYWVREKVEHYETGKAHIRELALDQGYKVDRTHNLKLRKLLQETYSARPEVPLVGDPDDDLDSEGESASGNARPRMTDAQWLKDTLQQLENGQNRGPPRVQSFDKIPNQGLPIISSRTVNGDKRCSVSSPLMARNDTLPASLKARRQRILHQAALSTMMDISESSPSLYPPNTPDRPAPLSLKSGSSGSLSASGTPTTRRFPSPLTTSALESLELLESLDASTNFNEVIRKSVTSPRAKYRFASSSPSPFSTLQQSTDSSYQIVDKADGDVFGTAENESAESDIASELTSKPHERRGRLSIIHETGSTRNSHYSLNGVSRLSDADWQTELSGEDQEESNGATLLSQDYEKFLIDAHEDPHGEYGLDNDPHGTYSLDPEDESDDEDAPSPFNIPFSDLSTYIGSSDNGSILETASNYSDDDPTNNSQIQYTYATPSNNDLTSYSSQSTVSVAVDYYRPLPLRHYESPTQDERESSIHPALRKNYSHDLVSTGAADAPHATQDTNTVYTSPKAYFKETIGQPPSHIPPTPPTPHSGTKSSPATPQTPTLPIKSPLRSPLRMRSLRNMGSISKIPRLASTTPKSSKDGASINHQHSHEKENGSGNIADDTYTDAAPTTDTHDEVNAMISRLLRPLPHSSLKPHTTLKTNLLAKIHNQISTTHLSLLLNQTRTQASTAAEKIDWTSLSPFERTWRIVNREVLEGLFGCVDVVLTGEDVQIVEEIVGRLGGGV
ncbi:hypothetical protein T440DRAFT_547638 [Plenodomus tracheiphilus IPT5]|uniref:Uncharacterized protein n=1 Tax=Plenodomus tracheiphilus IPT5 TaxID=1408161 RepID=A0A6A7BD81_9PLEO|nr:hypothetical protein T440DRAFT_547638 [Plenodomus tracheiphilus IPT5]